MRGCVAWKVENPWGAIVLEAASGQVAIPLRVNGFGVCVIFHQPIDCASQRR